MVPFGTLGKPAAAERQRVLDRASKAAARKRYRKAVALYRQALTADPTSAALHTKLAPLLARCRLYFDAWMSFQTAARHALREGQTETALGVYRSASTHLPRELEVWTSIASLEQRRGRAADAVAALREGRRHFRRRKYRPQAIYLLRQACEVDPRNLELTLDLARLLGRTGQRYEAQLLLRKAAQRSHGRSLRRVRAAQWRLSRSLSNTWLWLRAYLAGDRATA